MASTAWLDQFRPGRPEADPPPPHGVHERLPTVEPQVRTPEDEPVSVEEVAPTDTGMTLGHDVVIVPDLATRRHRDIRVEPGEEPTDERTGRTDVGIDQTEVLTVVATSSTASSAWPCPTIRSGETSTTSTTTSGWASAKRSISSSEPFVQ